MKSRIATSIVFILIAATAFAADAATQSDAQKSFDKMKTLAGSWEGHVTTVPRHPRSTASSCRFRFARLPWGTRSCTR